MGLRCIRVGGLCLHIKGEGTSPSTSQLASERRRAREHGQVQEVKFQLYPEVLNFQNILPIGSRSDPRHQSDDSPSQDGSQAGMIVSGVHREGAGRSRVHPTTAG